MKSVHSLSPIFTAFMFFVLFFVTSSCDASVNSDNSSGTPKNGGEIDRNNKMSHDELAQRLISLENTSQKEIEALKEKTVIPDDIEKLHILWAWREHQKIKDANLKVELQKEIESLKTENKNHMLRIDQLEEKFLSTKALPNKKNENSSPFKMPKNCKDLSELGHTSSGFHLVRDAQLKKLVTIFCNFKSSNNNVVEKQIGYVDVKSLPNGVYFYAKRKASFNQRHAIVPFDLAPVNEGKALNLNNGIFTAPVPGIYYFSFKGVKDMKTILWMEVHLRLNRNIIGTAHAAEGPKYSNMDVHATLKLKTGDQVDLYKGDGSLIDNGTPDTHFTGMLLEEELESVMVDNQF